MRMEDLEAKAQDLVDVVAIQVQLSEEEANELYDGFLTTLDDVLTSRN